MRLRSKVVVFVAVALAGLSPFLVLAATQEQADSAAAIRLPAPQTRGGMDLTEALATRRSQRAFDSKPLSAEQVSQLCWAAQGITDIENGLRTAPSALKLYALRVFVIDERGAHEYLPQQHALRTLAVSDALTGFRAALSATLHAAPMYVLLTIEPERLRARCGEKSERFSLLEAGHAAQNVLLQATAMGLASVPAGGFNEEKVSQVLELPSTLKPVYVLPVGNVGK
jgi:SagB-type dehydrogenase family enzyme